jgi:hypothetical protein
MAPRRHLGIARTFFMFKNDTLPTSMVSFHRHFIMKFRNRRFLLFCTKSRTGTILSLPRPPFFFPNVNEMFIHFWISFLSLSKPFFSDHRGATWRIMDTIFSFYSENVSPNWSTLDSFYTRYFILSPTLRPKTTKTTQSHSFTDLGWIWDAFGFHFDRF